MTLALTLDADKHSALDSALQDLYVKQDDGNYRLDADIPDNSGLKAKADELLGAVSYTHLTLPTICSV